MTEIMTAMTNNGIAVVIAAMFLFEHYTNNKKTRDLEEQNAEVLNSMNVALLEMKKGNENTAKALEIIRANQLENYKMILENDSNIERKIDCIKEKAKISKK